MVSVERVSFGYQKDADNLRDVNLTVRQGECILLCGESGCGKTTVTKLVNGLIPHFVEGGRLQGRVTADGLCVADTPLYEIAGHVGSVFQNPKSQFFHLDSDSELTFGLENEGAPPERIRERLRETVRALEIEKLRGRNIFAMSGGEKQTLAFASVYMMDPQIYVLDEPSANLDGEAVKRLQEQLRVLKAKGKTILIAEHRLYFLMDLIDGALYIRNGEIAESFTRESFRALDSGQRQMLGLRATENSNVSLPVALPGGGMRGLSVENLTCAYQKKHPVFKNLSFTAAAGEVLAITGNNGVGKSTLVRCLCGFNREQYGAIRLDGRELRFRQRRKEAFCVMQDVHHQLFSDSVWGECELASGSGDRKKTEAVLEDLNLLSYRDAHPVALSGGQKQRLAVACAILSGKKLLLFDEPTSGLDLVQMQRVTALVRSLAEEGRIVLVITHDMEFLTLACDRVLEL